MLEGVTQRSSIGGKKGWQALIGGTKAALETKERVNGWKRV